MFLWTLLSRRRAFSAMLFTVVSVATATWAQTDVPPSRAEDNLIVASYNIKWLGQAKHEYAKLAEVVEHFDVCGIIEVKSERALEELVSALEEKTGKDWGYVFGIRTHRPGGLYHETYGAVWRRDRVELGDGLVSDLWDMEEAFRNDPFFVSFKRGSFDFTLLLVHTRWSNDADGTRANEVAMVAEHLTWVSEFLVERDIIVAGDFNYSGTESAMEEMASAAGLTRIDPNEKSTYKSDGSGYANPYDHMYVVSGQTPEYVEGSCHVFDGTRTVYGSGTTNNRKKAAKELSDHLPIYAIFTVSAADDD
jgi:endonuclease/exonuclease/phosphatase family metal-dependent hydrolase